MGIFEANRAGSWHNREPGETRLRLDLTGLIAFYDPILSSLVEAPGQGWTVPPLERNFHDRCLGGTCGAENQCWREQGGQRGVGAHHVSRNGTLR
jgi:hypothetical protein